MLESLSLRGKFIGLIVGTSLITTLCVGAFFIYRLIDESAKQVENYRQTLTEAIEAQLINETQTAVSLIEEIHQKQQKGELTEEQARKEAADRVRDLRYDNGAGYFWVDTYEGVNVVLLGRPTEGKSRIDLVDPQGRHFIREMIDNGRKTGGGFTDLMFAKPNETEPLPKRNYTVAYEPYHWVLGTGVWIDDIDEKVALQQAAASDSLRSSIIGLLIFIVVLQAAFVFIAVWLSNVFVAPIVGVTKRLEVLATGDFRNANATEEIGGDDEIGAMSRGLDTLRDSIRKMLRQVVDSATQVSDSATQLTSSADQSAMVSGQIADSIVKVAGACSEQFTEVENADTQADQLSKHMDEFAEKIARVGEAVTRTNDAAGEGEQKVTEAMEQMKRIAASVSQSAEVITALGEESNKIGAIVDAISAISEQTNLLSLNAAIEAARAGEHGRGFAVVADEVRKLAEQSSTSAGEIAALIGSIQTKANNAVQVMQAGVEQVQTGAATVDGAGAAFHDIANMVNRVAGESRAMEGIVRDLTKNTAVISAAVQKISTMSRDVASETETVSAATQEQTATMHEIAGASRTLSEMSQNMQIAVGKFKI